MRGLKKSFSWAFVFSGLLLAFAYFQRTKLGDYTVRVAFDADTSVTAFDPSRIQMGTEAVVLANLYSPLVTESNDGLIQPFLAEHYHWEENTLHLRFRKDFKTVDGWTVSAKDAEFSLKRILISNSNAHGNLALFLCPGSSYSDINAPCGGIAANDSELLLTVAKASYKQFLLKLIASMDFGIVPKAACNLKSPKLEIVDYRNTTGVYYVERDDPHGAFILRANPGHWLRQSGIPQQLNFVPTDFPGAHKMLEDGNVDFITSIMVPRSRAVADLKADARFSLFETYPFNKLLIGSSHSRLKKFTVPERLAIHEAIRHAFFNQEESAGWTPSLDFYPSLGEGALTAPQMEQLKASIDASNRIQIHRKISLGVFTKRGFDIFSKGFKDDKRFEVMMISNMAPFLEEAKRPDFYVYNTDSAFLESFSLVSYNVTAEGVALTKEEAGPWLERYMSYEDKAERIRMLKELNFQTLSQGIVGILGEAPYTEIARKPFHYEGSKYFVAAALWKIRRD